MSIASHNIAVVILAAGSSSRMGRPKQLLAYGDDTLLGRVVAHVLAVREVPAFVVIGANKALIRPLLEPFPLTIVEHDNWALGMAGSVVSGLQAVLQKLPDTTACLFAVADQPLLDTRLLRTMIQVHQHTGKGIVAAEYDHAPGTPILFHRRYFDELLALEGQQGARKTALCHPDDLALVAFPQGAIDVDTPEDYTRLTGNSL